MDREFAINILKAQLLRDLAYLCCRKDIQWSEPITHMLGDIREMKLPAVFFGGTLRSLLLSRINNHPRIGRPRDVDIVINGATVDDLKKRFRKIFSRETRFGGLQIQKEQWQFDIWPLDKTWAFVDNNVLNPNFSNLPTTTFFNLEAIAVDVWPLPGHSRKIYAGNDQFFDGILSQTVEINNEENPFPALCVIRALIMASSTGFSIGPKLARYLANNCSKISDDEIDYIQIKHYGGVRIYTKIMRNWLTHIKSCYEQNGEFTIKLPAFYQPFFWPNKIKQDSTLTFHVLASNSHKTHDRHLAKSNMKKAVKEYLQLKLNI